MKAKLVSENISFERGRDPKSVIGVGDKEVREIRNALDFVTPYVKTMRADEMDFKKFRWEVDKLLKSLEFIVTNHLNEKYNLGLEPFKMDYNVYGHYMENIVAMSKFPTYEIHLRKNGVGNAFYISVVQPDGKTLIEESSQSNRLDTLDKKVGKILRKLNHPK